MNFPSYWVRLSAGFLLLAARPAPAQTSPAPQPAAGIEQRVYTYVEQMPQLPGGGGNRAVQEAIKQRLVIARKAAKGCAGGQVQVQFTVDAAGAIKDAHIERGLDAVCNEAVLAAVRQLPAFSPGVQNGRKVAVRLTVPVPF
ncbi:energy transducer TonB [Hymenobacter sp. DH14]|uniref:Energy transducer TonB n=1 Tax=Hymenobacter cyanobacteriorum TaxID=2926463 RepID=A0A9X1VCM9_9BACT|nr:TonB family protein [Hymenobacter cyanobacteriorum]MCI1186694.1 energy transducer TonB [Hymenobacter cyanobacteriorum]